MIPAINQAKKAVPLPQGEKKTLNAFGITTDIIQAVRKVFKENYQQTARLVQLLRGSNDLESAKNVFRFVRNNIRYDLDPPGKQFIRTPADIVHNQTADCKGLAILINSLLANLNIRSAFRFVSFSPSPTVTHVYSLAFIGNQEYILDACLPQFNDEKKYTFKQDHMTEIIEVSGFPRFSARAQAYRASLRKGKPAPRPVVLPGTELVPGETPLGISGLEPEGLMDLKLQRQSLEIDRHNAAVIHGIGSPAVADLNESIAAVSGAIGAYKAGNYYAVASIGAAIGKKAKKKKNNIFKKVGAGIKKAAKKVVAVHKKVLKLSVKAATLPLRLTVKAIAEVMLPKVAPFFLYLFVTNPDTISKLPAKVQRKRKKSEKFAKFMTKTIGMKEAHFMQIVSNGIKRKYKKSPEQILTEKLKGMPISGIGVAPLVALIPTLIEMIGKIAKMFKKKPAEDETPTAEDAPDLDNDFAEMAAPVARKLVAHLTHKPASHTYQAAPDLKEDARALEREQSVMQQIDFEPTETPVDAPLPTPEPAPGEYTEEGENFNEAAPETPVRAAAPEPSGETSSSSKMPLLLGAAGLALAVVASSGSKRRK